MHVVVPEEVASLEEVATQVVTKESSVKVSDTAPEELKKVETPKPAPFAAVMQKKPEFKVILPEDPANAFICEGCE